MERWELAQPIYVPTAKKMTVQETQTPEGKPFRKQGEHPVPTRSSAAGGVADLRWGKGWG